MKFRIEDTFKNITLEEYEKLHFDEEFNIAMCKAVKLSRDLKKVDDDGTTFHRAVLVGPDRVMPAAMKKVVKVDRIEYEERIDYKWGSYEARWETIPNIMPNKVTTNGKLGFKEVPGGVLRWSEGEIKVKILGVGGMVEKFIVADVEKSYVDAANFTQRWIDDHQD
ncbi:MAG: DUF2505 family protein [Deltaproteobacteria bacterium]|nr:DUF2505 family protein [Deltaproteobacteria bacterium]